MRRLPIILLSASLIAPAGVVISRAGATAKPAHPTYALRGAKHCRPHYRKATEHHKVKGKIVRYVGCVYVPPALAAVPGGSTGNSVASTSTHTGTARASIDPTYVQDPVNPLKVTFTYFAGVADNPLPNGVLSLYWGSSPQSQTLACSENVGGTHGTSNDPLLCTITFAAYGREYVTTQYTSGSSSATQTDTEDIENPNPAVVVTTTTTTAPSTTTTVHETRAPYTGGSAHTVSATVIDQNGASVALQSSQITFKVIQDGNAFLSTPASSNASCIFDTSPANANRIAFGGNGGIVTTCSFAGGGDYGPDTSTYGVIAVYSGSGSIPGSTSAPVTITTP